MKLDLNKNFKKSISVQLPEVTMALQMASYLMAIDGGMNSVKFYHFAEKLEQQGFIDIDEADRKTLYDFINMNKIGSGIKAQLLLEISNAKETK